MAGLSIVSVVVFVSIIAVVIVTLGAIGRPVFTSPRCSKCSYDLRAMNFMAAEIGPCPECGSTLSQPGSVTFGKFQRDRRKIWVGFALLVIPWMLLIPLSMVSRRPPTGPGYSTSLSTPALLARLPNSNEPWDWQEMQRRLAIGSLTTQQVDAAFAALSGPAATRAIPWADGFIRPAIQRKLASPQAITSLFKANLGTAPQIQLRSRTRVNQPLLVEIQPDRTSPAIWIRLGSMIWSLASVETAGDKKLNLVPTTNPAAIRPFHLDQLSGEGRSGAPTSLNLGHDLPLGEHELTFTFDIGVVDTNVPLRGVDGRPGRPDKWPPAHATWQEKITRKALVVGPDEPVITMVTDPKRDPTAGLSIGLDPLVVRPSVSGAQIVIRWRLNGSNPIALSYIGSIDASGTRIDLGNLSVPASSSARNYSSGRSVNRPSLPELPATVDVVLTPDPIAAERMPGVDEIWGVSYVVRGVPVERYDLSQQ